MHKSTTSQNCRRFHGRKIFSVKICGMKHSMGYNKENILQAGTMKFATRVYFIAGIYGLIAVLPNFFLENKNSHDYPPAITHPEYYYGFFGVGLAWQILFILI